ncbi:MAG: hypothetical protein KAT09_05410, partial [Candidatus Aegiribacteria sp.]|nr:hypothetical protein [Candidatus Aegiribacteria sp.]
MDWNHVSVEISGSRQKSGSSSRGIVVVLLAIAVVVSVFLLINSFGVQLVDDGYYYLEIARNISCGNGFTFDGLNRTNGFHPLWQVMLVPVFLLTQSRVLAAQAVTMLQTLLFAASGFVLYRILLENTKKIHISIAGAAFWLFNFWFWSKGALSGMETGLLILCYGISLLLFSRSLRGLCSTWLLSISLIATCMARLDSLALVAGVYLIFLFLRRYRDASRAGLPVMIYLILYMIINKLVFGGMFPVSGYIKSATGSEFLRQLFAAGDTRFFQHGITNFISFATLGGRLPLLVAFAAIGGTLWTVVWFLRTADTPIRELMAVCCSYIVCLLIYYSFMYDSLLDVYTYYWFPVIFGVMIAFVLLLSRMRHRLLRQGFTWVLLAGLVVFNIVYARDRLRGYSCAIPDSGRPERNAVIFLNTLDDGTVIGSWDAGYVGYYCRHRVINLDGLVNSYEYQAILHDQGLEKYLDMQ